MSIKNNLRATTNPDVTDDITQGYAQGSRWLNMATGQEWIAYAVTEGAAVWFIKNVGTPWQSGQYMWPRHIASLTTAQPATGKLIFMPFPVSRRVTIDRVGAALVTSQTGAACRLGVYSAGPDSLLPSTLLASAGEISLASGSETIVQNAPTTGGGLLTLNPGMYWLAAAFNNASTMPTMRAAATATLARSTNNTDVNAGRFSPHLEANFTYGSLPASAPTLSSTEALANAVIVGVRRA